MSLSLELSCDSGRSPWEGGGSCLCTKRWPRHLLPNFPKWECSVDTLRLFLSVCWMYELLIMIIGVVIVLFLTIVIWCLLTFFLYNKLTLAILYFVVGTWMIVNLCSWEQTNNSNDVERDSFVGAAKPMWWRWNYFRRELCFVINSSVAGSLILF